MMKRRSIVLFLCISLAMAGMCGTGLAIGGTFVQGSSDTSTLAKAQLLPSTDVTVTNEIVASTDIHNYMITVSSCGRLEIQLSMKMEAMNLRLLDSAGNQVFTKLVNSSSIALAGTYSATADLTPGIYYIQTAALGNYTGSYILLTGFTASAAQYTAGNETIATASRITMEQKYTGFLAHNKQVEMLRIDLTSGGRVTFQIAMQPDLMTFSLYDATGGQILNTNINASNMLAVGFYETYADLNPGSYYLSFKQYGGLTGWYTVIPTFAAAGNTDSESNDTFATANTAALSQQVKGLLAYNDKVDNFKFTAPNAGTLTVRLNQQASLVTYSIYNTTGNRVSNKVANISEMSGKGFVDWAVTLPLAGTYYLQVEQYSSLTGWYTFTLSMDGGSTSTGTGYDLRVGSYTLKLRSLPSTTASVITTITNGQKLRVTATSGAWSSVQLPDGKTGWVASANIGKSPYSGTENNSQLRVLSGTLKFRTEPNSSAAIIEDFKNGRKVTLMDNSTNTLWVKVRTSNGVMGWVASAYIGLVE